MDTVQYVTGLTCIVQEPNVQNAQRPPLPYMGLKLTTPAAHNGYDAMYLINDTTFGWGGNRKMSVSFHCYALTPEDAYNYMALWQGALALESVQNLLRRTAIAVWLIGNVADLSQLLNTGYEGRSQMDVQFGITSNMKEDLGEIDTVQISGTANDIPVGPFTAPE